MLVNFRHDNRILETVFNGPSPLQSLANEPCLFSCDPQTVREKGGPLAKQILSRVEYHQFSLQQAVIDVRVQRLMPGMYPSIPGWHCDGVPRDNYFAQPDFSRAHGSPSHFVLIQSSHEDGVSRTEYTSEEFQMDLDVKSGFIYKQLHDRIEQIGVPRYKCEQGKLYAFSHFQPHRTSPCTSRGWRMFFRLSYYHNPPIANKVESVQQVYLLSEANGW